jgi:hypothetical protein
MQERCAAVDSWLTTHGNSSFKGLCNCVSSSSNTWVEEEGEEGSLEAVTSFDKVHAALEVEIISGTQHWQAWN